MTSTSPSIISQTKPLFDFLKKQQENQRFVKSIENFATIALIIFFLVFAVRPTILTISALVGEIKSKEVLQKEMRQKINDVIQAQDNFSQVQERYLTVNSSLPDSPYYTDIGLQLQSIASSSGFSISQINYELNPKDQANSPLSYFVIKINSQLPFNSFLSFLEQISNFRRLISFQRLSLSTPKEEAEGDVGLSISAQTFYWQQQNGKK